MKRNKFSLSHYKLGAGFLGYLYPLTWYEAIPGDTIQHATSMLIRLATLTAPLMHPIKVRLHHWFVPNRLIWDDWEDFITGGEDGTSVPTHPYFTLDSDLTGQLGEPIDWFGIPPLDYTGKSVNVSALPMRAYKLIWNEFYRDQQIDTAYTIDTTSGADSTTSWTTCPVSWEKDYYTTCRTAADLGDAVSIPVQGTGNLRPEFDATGMADKSMKAEITTGNVIMESAPSATSYMAWEDPKLEVDIEDLRTAMAIKRFQEARNQYGSRYVEYLRYLGVRSSDARLQKPEYLGGGTAPISISEVLNTGHEDVGDYIGDMKGHGIGAARTRRFRRFFEEHGIVMTLASVVPKAMFASGLHRSLNREDKEDYFTRELQSIGEQAVLNKELYAIHTTQSGTFGYQGRYDEYKSLPSQIAGEFRDSLSNWHMARQFGGDPSLNTTFLICLPSTDCFADTSGEQIYLMTNHSIQARRMIKR